MSLMTTEKIGAAIIETASTFLGLHEVKQNAEWDNLATPGKDPAAQELWLALRRCGWQMGWPYCAAFCEAVWRIAYSSLAAPESLQKQIEQRCNPSVLSTFNNWKAEGSITHDPIPGSIFFMQLGNGAHGHAGIVVKSVDDKIATIEANTSPMAGTAEADREGDGIFRKVRRLDFDGKPGLWLKGFLNPIAW